MASLVAGVVGRQEGVGRVHDLRRQSVGRSDIRGPHPHPGYHHRRQSRQSRRSLGM